MNPLDAFAKLVLSLYGVDTEALRQEQNADRRRAQNRNPINAKGQTSAFNRSGGVRNYQNTKQALTRPPTLDSLQSRGGQATPPNRPPGGFGQSPGQTNLFGNNPSATPSGSFRAPKVGIPVQGAAGPDIPPRLNPYRATGQNLAPGMTGGSGLSIGGLMSHPLVQGLGIAESLLNAFGTSILEETFGSGRVMEDFQKSRKPKPQPQRIPQQEYSGMEDMSGDPIRPEVEMGRSDPFAPVDPVRPEPKYVPGVEPPPPVPTPRVPTRKEVVNEAYDALREQLRAGQISHDDFLKKGMKMHKDYFNKK